METVEGLGLFALRVLVSTLDSRFSFPRKELVLLNNHVHTSTLTMTLPRLTSVTQRCLGKATRCFSGLNGFDSRPKLLRSKLSISAGKEHDDTTPTFLKGTVLDHSINLQNVRPGDQIEVPYEITLTETMVDFWLSAFFDLNRISTSRPFCRKMGLQDRVLPFSLALFLTSSMSHADAAKVQVGFGHVNYLWPLFSGDTVTKTFTVDKIRRTSDGNHSIIHFTCDLINQRGRVCMRADKRLLFQFPVAESSEFTPYNKESMTNKHLFRDHMLSKGTTILANQPSHSLTKLERGTVILHTLHRCLTFSQSQQLASLARLTHERHFDTRRYDRSSDILIPGGLVLGITLSASYRDLHEILHEEVTSCSYVNRLHPDNIVGAVSYIADIQDNLPGDLELVTVVTLGIKNLDVRRELQDVLIPLDLFQPGIFSKEIEAICKASCPELSSKIVVQVERKLLRQTNRKEVFLL